MNPGIRGTGIQHRTAPSDHSDHSDPPVGRFVSANGTESAAGTHITAVSPRVTGTATPIPPAGQWVAVENEGAFKTWICSGSEPGGCQTNAFSTPTSLSLPPPHAATMQLPQRRDCPGQHGDRPGAAVRENMANREHTGSCSWAGRLRLAFQAGSRLIAPTHSAVPRTGGRDSRHFDHDVCARDKQVPIQAPGR